MNSRQLLKRAAEELRQAGIEDAEVDASVLLSHVTGRPPLSLRLGIDFEPDEADQARFRALLTRRLNREPLQYILGTQPFCGRAFMVDERVLIPRPETELLAEKAVAALRTAGPGARALDLCCGSGCLAVTLALEVPSARVEACDLSADALEVTAENARRLGASLRLLQGDLWQAVGDTRYDVIVSNPPYIPSEDCAHLQPEVLREPTLALDGGSDGLALYRRIAEGAVRHLLPGGALLMELGIGEDKAVRALLEAQGLTEIAVWPDLNGIARMIGARLPR